MRFREQSYGGQGAGMVREFVMDVSTLLYLKWITKGTYCEAQGLCSVLCGSLDGREVWRRMDVSICMAKSLHSLPETMTTLLIGSTPMQNKKVKKRYLMNEWMNASISLSVSEHPMEIRGVQVEEDLSFPRFLIDLTKS